MYVMLLFIHNESLYSFLCAAYVSKYSFPEILRAASDRLILTFDSDPNITSRAPKITVLQYYSYINLNTVSEIPLISAKTYYFCHS